MSVNPARECADFGALKDDELWLVLRFEVPYPIVFVEDGVESLEDELVEKAANQWGSLPIFIHHVFAYLKRNRNESVEFARFCLPSCQISIDPVHFRVELLLLSAEHIERDGVVVVGLEKFVLLALELQLLHFQTLALLNLISPDFLERYT